MNNGKDNRADNVEEMAGIDSPFVEKEESTSNALNRTELMEKTAKELAVMAMPYVALKEVTLRKMAKSDLCDIIMSKGQNKEEKKSSARASRTTSDSEAIINTLLMMVESFKLKRESEPLNAVAKEIFKNNATNIVDKKVDEEAVSSHGVNTAVTILTATFLLVDGLVGLQNVPTLFSKIKSKFKKKNDTK